MVVSAMSEYPERRDPRLVVLGLAVVVVIAIASIVIISTPPATERPTLLVYTYDSFMWWGDDPDTIFERAFGAFEERYDCNVTIERLQTDANGIVSRLGTEKSNPVADVVIGIDNILILQSGVTDLLTPYEPSNLDVVNSTFIDALDPDHYVVPFDFGLVTLIYKNSSLELFPELNNLTFADLASPALASGFVTQDPKFSSPGLAFLLTEIAVHEKILHVNWTDWWMDVNEYIDVQPGWSESWSVWYDSPSKHIMNSYGTDGAYSVYFYGGEPETGIAPIYHDGDHYAWMQVEGMGLVKNGPNPELAKLFIDYCLNETVQSLIATNQWMFPVRTGIALDPAFEYALHPSDVSLLNELLPRTEIAANLTTWLDTFDEIRIA
ncbi:MAG: thiamine ABC transporter substrate-binding protein [Promethearchaeota archaeon]